MFKNIYVLLKKSFYFYYLFMCNLLKINKLNIAPHIFDCLVSMLLMRSNHQLILFKKVFINFIYD